MQTAANVRQHIISPQQRRVNVTDAPASGLQGETTTASAPALVSTAASAIAGPLPVPLRLIAASGAMRRSSR